MDEPLERNTHSRGDANQENTLAGNTMLVDSVRLFLISEKIALIGALARLSGLINSFCVSIMLSLPETPLSNTGLNSQFQNSNAYELESSITVKLDWLQLRTLHDSEQSFLELLEVLGHVFDDSFDFAFDRSGFMGRRWSASGQSVRGIKVFFDPPGDSSPGVGLVILTGSVLAVASAEDLWDFCSLVRAGWCAVATRLDVALDDYEKSLNFEDILVAAEADNFALCHSAQFHKSKKRGGDWGCSLIFGSSQSDKRVTFYDKSEESGGLIDAYRLEVRFRNYKADKVFEQYVSYSLENALSESSFYLAQVCVGSVDFLDRSSGDKNLSRLPRLSWWQAFLNRVAEGVRVPSKRRQMSVERSINWIFHSVAPTLAVLRHVLGVSAYNDMLQEFQKSGEIRLSKYHWQLINIYQQDWEKQSDELAGVVIPSHLEVF